MGRRTWRSEANKALAILHKNEMTNWNHALGACLSDEIYEAEEAVKLDLGKGVSDERRG